MKYSSMLYEDGVPAQVWVKSQSENSFHLYAFMSSCQTVFQVLISSNGHTVDMHATHSLPAEHPAANMIWRACWFWSSNSLVPVACLTAMLCTPLSPGLESPSCFHEFVKSRDTNTWPFPKPLSLLAFNLKESSFLLMHHRPFMRESSIQNVS